MRQPAKCRHFFISSKLHCASLIFSLHMHDLDDRLRLPLVQYDCQNGGCRCFRLTFPRHFQMRRTRKPPRIKKSLLITVCCACRTTTESDLCRHVMQSDHACSFLPVSRIHWPRRLVILCCDASRSRLAPRSRRGLRTIHVLTLSALQFSSQVVA